MNKLPMVALTVALSAYAPASEPAPQRPQSRIPSRTKEQLVEIGRAHKTAADNLRDNLPFEGCPLP
jgi:hypothetical protein